MRARIYICDDCGARGEFTSYVKARAAHWAVSRDYSNCYCPKCAPEHRKGGANGKRTPSRKRFSNSFEQLKIQV